MDTYIFLDVDGVLNNTRYISMRHRQYGGKFFCQNVPFNPRSLRNLRILVECTKGKLVLTSTWRLDNTSISVLESRLAEYNLRLYGKTNYMYSHRGTEIRDYLRNQTNSSYNNILILDDEMTDIKDEFEEFQMVKVNGDKGLTWLKTVEALFKFNMQNRR